MATDFRLGCTYNIFQLDLNPMPLERFEAVRDAGVFDYINWVPSPDVLSACVAAAEKTGIPMTTGNYIHTLGRNDAMMVETMNNAARAGVELVNVMLQMHHADGHELTDDEIVGAFLTMAEAGEKVEVAVGLRGPRRLLDREVQTRDADREAGRCASGVRFRLTVDYSHVIFKIENPEQQEISGVREDVEAGRVILDPFETGNLLRRMARARGRRLRAVPPGRAEQPAQRVGQERRRLAAARHHVPDGEPAPGEWHAPWHAYKLEACKEGLRHAHALPPHPRGEPAEVRDHRDHHPARLRDGREVLGRSTRTRPAPAGSAPSGRSSRQCTPRGSRSRYSYFSAAPPPRLAPENAALTGS